MKKEISINQLEDDELENLLFNKAYHIMYTNGSHSTKFDGETFISLYKKIEENLSLGKSVTELAQAIHNIYAKRLSIAPLRVIRNDNLGEDCSAKCIKNRFSTGNTSGQYDQHRRSVLLWCSLS